MLRPILDALDEWTPPAGLDELDPPTHFKQRAISRCEISSIPGEALKWLVERALFARRDDLIERLWAICPATTQYRIMLPEGLFYPVVRDAKGQARTIYTQKEIKDQRSGRRKRKQRTGRRIRREISA